MRVPETTPVLADAADVLSDQLRTHLERLSRLLKPHARELDARFRTRLRKLRYDARQIKTLCDITPGAAARLFSAGRPTGDFFELVEYSGRRLAKLNVPPVGIVRALREYDRALDPVLVLSYPDEYKNFRWAREQLQFCVILTLNNAYYQVREAETEAFYSLFHAELEAVNLEDLVRRFLETLTGFCHAEDGRMLIFGAAQALILDPEMRARYPWFWSVPLMTGGRMAGLLQLAFTTEYHWLPRELELLDAASERCLRAVEKARLMEDLARREEQVRQLAEHMMQIEEEERRRLSRELHDEAGQSLLCIRLKLELMGNRAPAGLRGPLAETRRLTERTIAEIRRIIAALSPAALRQLTKHFRSVFTGRVTLRVPARLPALPHEVEIATFRLVQECFHNIAKHSKASAVNLSVLCTDELLRLNVEDNGVGFELKAALQKQSSFGLAGMRERVALLGGSFAIRSRLEHGVRISVELPVSRHIGKDLSLKPQRTRIEYGEDSSIRNGRPHAVSSGHEDLDRRRTGHGDRGRSVERLRRDRTGSRAEA